jgi:hypothetical protein
MTKREQAIADVNAATASESGVIKNQPLLYMYAVEQREAVLKLRDALELNMSDSFPDGPCFCDVPPGHGWLSHDPWCVAARAALEATA